MPQADWAGLNNCCHSDWVDLMGPLSTEQGKTLLMMVSLWKAVPWDQLKHCGINSYSDQPNRLIALGGLIAWEQRGVPLHPPQDLTWWVPWCSLGSPEHVSTFTQEKVGYALWVMAPCSRVPPFFKKKYIKCKCHERPINCFLDTFWCSIPIA